MAKGYMFGFQVPPDMPATSYAVSSNYAGGYIAFRIKQGYYGKTSESGYPEILISAEDLATVIGLESKMIKQGYSILGIRGTG